MSGAWVLVPSFLVLAEVLHYGRAARRLGISSQALSKRIARLEAQLGTPVVVSTTRRVTLTPAGLSLRDAAAPAVEQMARAVEQAQLQGRSHRLAIGISTDLTPDWEVRVATWVSERGTPAVFEHRPPDDALTLVRAGALDLVVLAGDVADQASEVVGHESLVVAFPVEHDAAAQTAIRIGDLRDLPVAVADAGGPADHRAQVEQLQGDALLPYVIAPRLGTIVQGLVHTAQSRRAAAVVLERSVERVDTAGLALRPMDPPLSIAVTLVGRPDLPADPLRGLADHLLGAPLAAV